MKKGKNRLLTKSERTSRKEKAVSFIILFLVCCVWMLPLLYMFGTSFKSEIDLQLHPELLFPSDWQEWTLDHYKEMLFQNGQVGNIVYWILNSLWSTVASVALTVILDLITAYAVVFLKFRGKNFFMKFLLLWMAVPGVMGTAPSFALYAWIRNTFSITGGVSSYLYIYFWIIAPSISGIFNFLLMKGFFSSIPSDIIDSAQSDGAGNAKIFFKIVCPLARSTVMLIVLFTFTSCWNNFMWPQLLLSSEDLTWQTLTVVLIGYTGGSSWGANGIAMATGILAMIPIIIVFIITQNKMIDGLASTGIKG